ncbi:hypothetical protein LZ198_09155 [Myxococcus sp. K15C18031901]|uniref:hypothetical protein n=1 Tax=Myxococcus dinghuensis TaxID=2906761 RepID=UPI0020A740A8|nr:hypothetical protein [Myxococcus dinghuensis]MCP3099040.1 hypothetical protein [Myxococcus dinghuensis]
MRRALGGLAAGILVLCGGEAVAQRMPFSWDVPDVVGVVDVSGPIVANGVPVKMSAVRSKARTEVILQHLVDRFLVWGLYVPPMAKQPQLLREPMVTAIDTRAFVSYTAILQPNPDGTTTVFLGQADFTRGPSAASSLAPVYPGGKGLLQTQMEGARTLVYSVVAKAADVEVFYRDTLAEAGFQEVDPLVFQSSQDILQVRLTPAKDGALSVVVVRRALSEEELVKPVGD